MLTRALVWFEKGDLDKALADYDEAIRIDPKDALAYNNRAWLRATCPDDSVRCGRLAIEDATKACELSAWNGVDELDTLAAAYAEAGEFDKAIEGQRQALDLAPDGEQEDLASRLKLYQEGKPYRAK
ncbi:MAG TPA: tetratricopeptide repeat protein [Pirellulales bacterium]|nr:tetratricopeptide repeat protein [Pirellulales bacterium]